MCCVVSVLCYIRCVILRVLCVVCCEYMRYIVMSCVVLCAQSPCTTQYAHTAQITYTHLHPLTLPPPPTHNTHNTPHSAAEEVNELHQQFQQRTNEILNLEPDQLLAVCMFVFVYVYVLSVVCIPQYVRCFVHSYVHTHNTHATTHTHTHHTHNKHTPHPQQTHATHTHTHHSCIRTLAMRIGIKSQNNMFRRGYVCMVCVG